MTPTPDAPRTLDADAAREVMGIEPREVRCRGPTAVFMCYNGNPAIVDGVWDEPELRTYCSPPPYSTDLNHARELVMMVGEMGLQREFGRELSCLLGLAPEAMEMEDFHATASATAEQLTRAALAAVRSRR